jgi:trk system potassium uptake protein TrkH
MVVTAAPGVVLLLWLPPSKAHDLSVREAILLVVILWVAICAFGALPFALLPQFFSPLDALFESTSGFTTTGSSILRDIEVLPRSMNFWRCFSHWLGGVGIVMLGVAILPMLGGSGHQIYRAQGGMMKSDRLQPRVAEASRALWFVYVSMSFLEYVALRLAGMDWFDAACHTFATVGTGGFSPRNSSVAAFQSPAVDYIIVFFMFAASINFAHHFEFGRTRDLRVFLRSSEVRFFTLVLVASTIFCTGQLLQAETYGFEEALRKSLFMVVSIGSTTGFAVADYNLWPVGTQILMLILMFFGGNAGSTSGGLKSFRMVLAFQDAARHMRLMVERRAVIALRLNGSSIPDEAVTAALRLIPIVFAIYAVTTIALALAGCDLLTSLSAPAATMFGVGPGWGQVGPVGNFAHLTPLAKVTLMGCMLGGRLEFFTVMLLFTRSYWRR